MLFTLKVILNIIALLSSLCLTCSLLANPRNSTKASQGSFAHGMGMERSYSDWLYGG
jgi:hypothetical protein